jgi:hypothetical protein
LPDRSHEFPPQLGFFFELFPPGGRELIILGLPVVIGDIPGTTNPGAALEPVESGV